MDRRHFSDDWILPIDFCEVLGGEKAKQVMTDTPMTEERAREISAELNHVRCNCEINSCQHREAEGYLERVEQEKESKDTNIEGWVRKAAVALAAADRMAEFIKTAEAVEVHLDFVGRATLGGLMTAYRAAREKTK